MLQMKGINKSFYGVQVLYDVDFELKPGEVMALLGENGAGKSTLMKILSGVYSKDSGDIYINNDKKDITSPGIARENGIAVVYQDIQYFPELSVSENLKLGTGKREKGLIKWDKVNQWSNDILKKFNIDIDTKKKMKDLSVGECQIITILEAVSTNNSIIVMDEPTSALNSKEVKTLFEIIDQLRKHGIGIIYISHRLEEVFEIADRFTVLRDGKVVGKGNMSDINRQELVEMMTGRKSVKLDVDEIDRDKMDVILEVNNLNKKGKLENVNFKLYKGEILTLSGLMGCGNKEIIRILYGLDEPDSGEIFINHKKTKIDSINKARELGLGFVPENRKTEGMIDIMSVKDNITLSNWKEVSNRGFFNYKSEIDNTKKWVDKLSIRMSGDIDQEVRYLSGGNQQKVVLARWLEADCDILILDEPTIGVDIGARHDIHKLLRELAKEGLSIIIVSSDIEEVLEVSDRIITLYNGSVTGEVMASKATKELLLEKALGGAIG